MTDARTFHHDNIVVDGLNASWFLEPPTLRRLHQGGVTAVNATLAAWQGWAETLNLIGGVYKNLEHHRELAVQVLSVANIHQAKISNRVGVIFGFQDTSPIEGKLHQLEDYHRLGVRVMQLTYNSANPSGYGCQAPEDKGLTGFGREVIAEMNRLGILLDLSHCGPRTTLEAIDASTKPVALTHANAAAFVASPRNKSDEALKACAARGGVIGAVAVPVLIASTMPATLADYLSAIDDLVERVGLDHVALGPDFMEDMPKAVLEASVRDLPPAAVAAYAAMPLTVGFESVTAMPKVTEGLLGRGYKPEDVRKIIGGNWLRLYEQVW
ncbi:MAG: membrane dipeptidase [Proteobacteria bacterium]|nr:membrane dipeptidase [Pseudomonadota bacterium]